MTVACFAPVIVSTFKRRLIEKKTISIIVASSRATPPRSVLLSETARRPDFFYDSEDELDQENELIETLDAGSSFLTSTIGTLTGVDGDGADLPLLYPLSLAASFLVLPLMTSIIWTALFVGFRSFGKMVLMEGDADDGFVDDDDGVPTTLLYPLSFLGSLVGAGVLSPLGLEIRDGLGPIVILSLVAVAVTVGFGKPSSSGFQQDLEEERLDSLRDFDNRLFRGDKRME